VHVSAERPQQQPQAAPQAQTQAPQSQGQSPQSPSQPEQNGNAQPVPAYRSPLASAADNGVQGETNADQVVPDTRLPAGAQSLSLGAPSKEHLYWAPFLDFSSMAYSNYPVTTGGSSWTTFGTVSGGINLREISGQSDFTLTYLGGGALSSDGSNNWSQHEFGIAERFTVRRTTFALMDQVGYFPQSGFGFNGLGIGGLSTNGSLGLQSGFATQQSILTAAGQFVDNSSIIELDRYLTRRSSLTLLGDYSIARYLDNGVLDSNEATFRAGYNYQQSRKSTIALFYTFDAFRFGNGTQSINAHSAQFSYARRIAGRLALQLSAGPQVAISREPLTATTGGPITGNVTQLLWTATADLKYQLRRFSLDATYSHGVTAGSGVFAGSVSDLVSVSASRQLTPKLNATLLGGYSRNTGLSLLGTTPTAQSANQTYNYSFAGARLDRGWGRAIHVYFGYQLQYQDSNLPSCVTGACTGSFLNHQVYFGLGWHPRNNIIR